MVLYKTNVQTIQANISADNASGTTISTLELHSHRDQLYSIFRNSVQWLLRRRFIMFYIELPMFKIYRLIYSRMINVQYQNSVE